MTVDHNVRKTAKKQWRRHAQEAEKKKHESGAPKRIRKKPNAKRRMCKGMCYQDPAATEVDKQWHNGDSDEEEKAAAYDSDLELDTRRAASGQQATTSGQPAAIGAAVKTARKGKQAKQMSTGVQLLDPQAAADSAPKTSGKRPSAAAAASAPIPAALHPFHPVIQSLMVSLGHIEPTPIQERCWPACCEGKDVQGMAEPGSGKTLAYLLPAMVRLKEAGHDASSQPDGPLLLVLTPTRELAAQVAQQCRHLRIGAGLRTACVYGGVPKEQQEELLKKKPHVVVATPGRLLDLLDSGATTLDKVLYVVLDEADKMLGLGFQQQLDRLHELLLGAHTAADTKAAAPVKKGKKRAAEAEAGLPVASTASPRPQVLLFTATMPPEVAGATDLWLRSPTRVTISHSAASISRTIVQVVQVCAEHKKPAKLLRHLAAVKAAGAEMRNLPRVLVFANRIKTVRFLHDTVSGAGYRVVMLHGQRSQTERDDAMRLFRSGKCQIMVATDVAARGLDIRALPYVVNYDFPPQLESYIHRVGRTGRLAAHGHAFSFFTRNMAKLSSPLVDLLNQHEQAVDPNLLLLADAWKEAVDRAGGEEALEAQLKKAKAAGGGRGAEDEDEEGEGEEEEGSEEQLEALMQQRLQAADVMEGLRSAGVLSKGKKKARTVQEQAPESSAPGAKKGRTEEDAAAAPPSMQQRLAKTKKAGAVEAAHQSELGAMGLAFVPAPKFSGARAGYLFKLGALGLGYYRDTAPKPRKASSAVQLQQRGKGPIVPSGRGKQSWSDDDDEDEDEHGGLGSVASKGSKGGKAAGAAKGKSGLHMGSKASESGGRKKAVPGRLRKKLKAQGK